MRNTAGRWKRLQEYTVYANPRNAGPEGRPNRPQFAKQPAKLPY